MKPQLKLIGLNFISIPRQKAGVGFLALNLFRQLIPQLAERQFIIYSTKGIDLPELAFNNVRQREVAPVSNIKKIFWEQFFLPTRIKNDKVDIVFNVHYTSMLLLGSKVKQITLVPDLTYVRYFFQRNLFKSLYICANLPFSLIKSNEIIAISEFTKSEIKVIFPFIPSGKIRVMYLGLGNMDEKKITIANEMKLLDRFKIVQKKYFIFVGTVEPTKNLFRNLVAFKSVLMTYPEYKFLIVGKRGWQDKQGSKFQKLKKFINSEELREKVIFTGYIDTDTLGVFYKNSKCLVFTSLYEGFGIPLLEAMYNNIPAITSKISSMPEVADEAALYVNPFSSDEICFAMLKILTDNNLVHQLVEKGKIQLKKFSWQW